MNKSNVDLTELKFSQENIGPRRDEGARKGDARKEGHNSIRNRLSGKENKAPIKSHTPRCGPTTRHLETSPTVTTFSQPKR